MTGLRRPGVVPILIGSAINLIWAGSLFVNPAAVFITPMNGVRAAASPFVLACILVVVAAAAIIEVAFRKPFPWGALLLIPQQIVLAVASVAATTAAVSGHYADGVARSHAFILADQSPIIVLCLAHALAIVVLETVAFDAEGGP